MSKHLYMGDDDFIDNPTTRVPVCILLDTSGSMKKSVEDDLSFKSKIEALNHGLNMFYDAVKNNDDACYAAEVSVVTFGERVEVIEDFGLVMNKKPVNLKAEGGTLLGHAMMKALELLEKRKATYKKEGIDYYQPWLVIMTDGLPGDMPQVEQVLPEVRQLEMEKKLSVFTIGIGKKANMDLLNRFSKRGALRLKGLKFEEFFEWLSKSIAGVSASNPGEAIKLESHSLWGEV